MKRHNPIVFLAFFLLVVLAITVWGRTHYSKPNNQAVSPALEVNVQVSSGHVGRQEAQLISYLESRLRAVVDGYCLDAQIAQKIGSGHHRDALLRELLTSPEWARGWRYIAQILAITSHNEATFLALREYVTRWDAAEDLNGVGSSSLIFGKIEAVASMGAMPFHLVSPFLFQLVDNESCRKTFSHWPDEKIPDSLESDKDFFIQLMRGRAAIGLALSHDPRGIEYVRKLHAQLRDELRGQAVNFAERTSPRMLNFELFFNLKDALVAHEVRNDLGVEQFLEWRIQEPESHRELTPYFEKVGQME